MKTQFKLSHLITTLKFMVLSVLIATAPIAGVVMLFSAVAMGAVATQGAFATSTYDPSGLTFTTKEVQSLAQVIYERVFKKPMLSDILTVVTGIKAKENIGYLGRLGLVGVTAGASCAPAVSAQQITELQKAWDPNTFEDRFTQCWKDIKASFWVWGLKNGIDKADLTDTDYMNFIEDRITDALWEAILRKAFFDDKQAALVSGSGVIVNSVPSINYFNTIDGIWDQLFTIYGVTPTTAIAKNAGTTFVGQAFTAADVTNKVIHGNFNEIIDGADYRLKDATEESGMKLLVTWSVYRQYQKELQTYTNLEVAYQNVVNGNKQLTFDGIPVVPLNFWDRYIRTYEQNGTKYNKPHRILLSNKDNLAIGVEESDMLSNMATWYERKDRTVYTDISLQMDAKVLNDSLTAVGY